MDIIVVGSPQLPLGGGEIDVCLSERFPGFCSVGITEHGQQQFHDILGFRACLSD